MTLITLVLRDVTHGQQYEDVSSFVGEDKTGSFGLLPNHDRFMTALEMGLCRFKSTGHGWLYVATSGALLYFYRNQLTLTTRHFMVDSNYDRISAALADQLLAEEIRLRDQKQRLRQMEEQVFKRLWELRRSETAYSHD